jgi:hypothetical protein
MGFVNKDQPLTVEPALFFQMLAQVSDGPNGTTANLAERLGIALDPDEGPIVITQGAPIITKDSGMPHPGGPSVASRKSSRIPSGYTG